MRAAGLGFSEAGDHAPRSRPDASALLGSRIHAPPRVGVCLVSESSDRPSRRLASCVPASVPLGHKRAHSEWNAPFPGEVSRWTGTAGRCDHSGKAHTVVLPRLPHTGETGTGP